MHKYIFSLILVLALSACAGKTAGKDECGRLIDAAWRELDFAKSEGFSGSVSYTKAVGLMTAAKTQQQFERFPSCIDKAKRARHYIKESRAGR